MWTSFMQLNIHRRIILAISAVRIRYIYIEGHWTLVLPQNCLVGVITTTTPYYIQVDLKAGRSQEMADQGKDLAPRWTGDVGDGDRLSFSFSLPLCFLVSNLEVITSQCCVLLHGKWRTKHHGMIFIELTHIAHNTVHYNFPFGHYSLERRGIYNGTKKWGPRSEYQRHVKPGSTELSTYV